MGPLEIVLIVLAAAVIMALGGLAVMLKITLPISRNVYREQLVRTAAVPGRSPPPCCRS